MHCALLLVACFFAVLALGASTCPPQGVYVANSTARRDKTFLMFSVENALDTDPVNLLQQGLQAGFRDAYGMSNAEITAYRDEELAYLNRRFGVNYLNATYPIDSSSPFSGFAQIPGSVLVPVFYDAGGNYRVAYSDNSSLPVSPNRQPLVQEAEFVITFDATNPPLLGGTYSPEGNIRAPPGGSIRFGLYKICSAGREFRFKIRSYYPTVRYPESNQDRVPLVERLMAKSDDFGMGWGTFDIVYPTSGPVWKWHVRSYFEFSNNRVWADQLNWEQQL